MLLGGVLCIVFIINKEDLEEENVLQSLCRNKQSHPFIFN